MNIKTSPARLRALGAVALIASACAGQAAAATVTAGCDNAPSKATAIFTNLANQAPGAPEVVVSTATATNSGDVPWGTNTTSLTYSPIEFSYNGSSLTGKARGTSVGLASGSIGRANFARITIHTASDDKQHPITVQLQNAMVGPVPLGTLKAGAVKCWTVSNITLDSSFSVTGSLALKGNIPGGKASVQIDVGYVGPSDVDAPVVTDVDVNPDPVVLNGTATVSAIINDVDTGGSVITSAEYSLNDGAWMPMAAVDAFDTSLEGALASFTAAKIGENRVCVRGTDAAGLTSAPQCQHFRTIYNFEGFYSPIDMGILNSARAGQSIPTKWRLTDANGAPINDPASFRALYSSANACAGGLPTDAIEEDASGSSGLQYLGDGYWQFNWKTPKTYASTCRGMYVEFQGGQTSPLVLFQFRR
ncbi:PxKF domain-containing protein [Lysobacter korlensis]|uniref:PxKF domain-containing protein n=1 Tax=Lysobacter korlensis TaxID=553636 RepID=A0ABV6RRJ7_9GAMM